MTDLTRIGDGPVATVYSGHRAGVPVAVKVFPKRFDKRTLSAFTKEQAKLATVRRVTSILMVDGVEEMPSGESALRMELCTQSLAALVERVGPLSAPDVAILGRAMATALAAAHSVGVVHGGVAPSNVLFRDNNEPVVGDFGIVLRQAFTRDPLHAIEYLPPETLRTGTLNELTDLYGLGAVLHFALTARSPHPGRLGEQPGDRVLRILGEPVPAINRQDVPVGLSTLVARLLATTPERRPQEAAQVADHLTAMLPNPPTSPPTEDWDDFDQPSPTPVQHSYPEPPLDFDDFALVSRPNPAGPARPQPRLASPPPRMRPPALPATAPAPSPRLPDTAWPPPGPLAAPDPASLGPTPADPPSADPLPAEPFSAAPLRVEPAPAEPLPVGPLPAGPFSVEPLRAEPPAAEPPSAGLFSAEPLLAGPVPVAPLPAEPLPSASASDEQSRSVEVPSAPLRLGEVQSVTDEFSAPRQPGVVLGGGRGEFDFGDDFGNVRRATVLAGPLAPPGQPGRRLIRYELIAGAALLLALLALVPLLLLRSDPDEIPSTPRVPSAGGADTGAGVTVELAEPTDLSDKVQLTWKATRDLDFAVVVAAEGESTRVVLAERNRSMTVEVEPGRKYCFMIQASDGDRVYESDPRPLRGATCRK